MRKLNQAAWLKIAAMLVATPRYVGLMLYLSGFVFGGLFLSILHIAEGVAGLSLAVLEGFALAYILSRRQLGFSRLDKTCVYAVVGALLVLLPLCATPYLWFLFNGSNLFAQGNSSFVVALLKFGWIAATISMPILIIVGVALVEKDPADVAISLAEREAVRKQTIAKIEAETKQTLLKYRLLGEQTRTEYKQKGQETQQNTEQIKRQDFVCRYCGNVFTSVKALAGHTGHCKSKANGNKKVAVGELS